MATATPTVGKRAVRILLECCLVFTDVDTIFISDIKNSHSSFLCLFVLKNTLQFYRAFFRVALKNLCSVAQQGYQGTNLGSPKGIFGSPTSKEHDSNSDLVIVKN